MAVGAASSVAEGLDERVEERVRFPVALAVPVELE